MIEKLKNNKTLFLNVKQAQKLGINNPLAQEIFLDDQKLNVDLINDIRDEFYLDKAISKGYAYFNNLQQFKAIDLDILDHYQFAKVAVSNLDEYEQLVYTKTRQYLINKEFWTNDGLDAFVGDDFKRKQLTNEEIVNLKTKYDLWIQELHFSNARISKQIHNLSKHGQNELDYDQFYDKKATLESNLDILQILIYLKSSLLELDFDNVLKDDQNKISIRQLLVDDLEYLPFSFQRYDYESRRNFIKNSRQLVDESIDFDDVEYDVLHTKQTSQQTSKTNEPIKIAELKKFECSQLSDEQQANLEKEFYSAGAINCFDEVCENEQQTNINNKEEQVVVDEKSGYLKPRSYPRHHETPFMVDVENRVDFLMAGYEVVKNDDPYAIKQEALKNNILEQQKAEEEIEVVEQQVDDTLESVESTQSDEQINEELSINDFINETPIDDVKLENEDHTVVDIEIDEPTQPIEVKQEQQVEVEEVQDVVEPQEVLETNKVDQEQLVEEENKPKKDLSAIQMRLDEIVNSHEEDDKLQARLNSVVVDNDVIVDDKNLEDDLENNVNHIEQVHQSQVQEAEVANEQNAIVDEELNDKNLNNKIDTGAISVEQTYEPQVQTNDTLNDFEPASVNELQDDSFNQVVLENNDLDDSKIENVDENSSSPSLESNVNFNDYEQNNDLSSQIELTPADFEIKTQEINDETERLLNELNNNKPKQKKKFWTWFSSKKDK
ncbi:hypothetical protein FJM05_01685 [Ureaplasma urealyticum]|uniref:Uncharacterized protein n=1 Tax=Ureaplasma urealyticum TaxID=2130 RepID=A0AAP9D7D4_UREUR|nr:hypothetical protein [Ureaplasma urealyticum]QDI64903.1 hypothetical protein FJM05_01685 [Ureaplasma urealyticum]